LFIAHFLKSFAAELKLRVPCSAQEAHQALMDYDYPGNIRELKSIIERALIESGGRTIEEHHLHLLNEKSLVRAQGKMAYGRAKHWRSAAQSRAGASRVG
jgi:DNA-binding NtrC family response regulator